MNVAAKNKKEMLKRLDGSVSGALRANGTFLRKGFTKKWRIKAAITPSYVPKNT